MASAQADLVALVGLLPRLKLKLVANSRAGGRSAAATREAEAVARDVEAIMVRREAGLPGLQLAASQVRVNWANVCEQDVPHSVSHVGFCARSFAGEL
jgi:hypothetical protein